MLHLSELLLSNVITVRNLRNAGKKERKESRKEDGEYYA
jgi:hypothetical protein